MEENIKKGIDKKRIERAIKEILIAIGENINREGLKETPKRVADAYEEMFSGYNMDLDIKKFKEEDVGTISCKVDFYSICEHHLLPFYGTIRILYEADKEVLGLSKIARIVEKYSRRLQIQERLGKQIGDEIMKNGAKGVYVEITAYHFCMMMRGVKKKAKIRTVYRAGSLKNKPISKIMLASKRR